MKFFAVAIFGPTGTGKTALSLDLAENIGEIISVDSRQVYKYMDIGTAKPSVNQRSRIKHHLIDIITPQEIYTAGEFKRNSEQLIHEIISINKIPFLVGGTGLYFNALINGMAEIPKIDIEIKKYLNKEFEEKGQSQLYQKLLTIDPAYALKIHQNDSQRTFRALEVYYGTNRKLSDYISDEKSKKDIEFIKIGLNLDRKILYERINNRVDNMINLGLIEEVMSLTRKGYSENDPGMKTIGYKEILLYFKGNLKKDLAIDLVKQKSRNYAKRQITWFKITPDTIWFDPNEYVKIKKYIENAIIQRQKE